MTTYMPTCVTRVIYLDPEGPRAKTTCTIDCDDPNLRHLVTFGDGVTVSRHRDSAGSTRVDFIRQGNPVRDSLIALAERTIRERFDGEVL